MKKSTFHITSTRKIVRILFILTLLTVFSNHLNSQSFLQKYNRITDDNLESFMNDWHQWSQKKMSTVPYDTLAEICEQVFWHYQSEVDTHYNKWKDDAYSLHFDYKYITIPDTIKVSYYHESSDSVRNLFFMKSNADSVSFIESRFKKNKNTLYLTDSIENLLSKYVGGLPMYKHDVNLKANIRYENLRNLKKYISALYGHWGGYWHFGSMPVIYSIDIYTDAYVIHLRANWNSGFSIRIPKDKRVDFSKAEEVSHWQE